MDLPELEPVEDSLRHAKESGVDRNLVRDMLVNSTEVALGVSSMVDSRLVENALLMLKYAIKDKMLPMLVSAFWVAFLRYQIPSRMISNSSSHKLSIGIIAVFCKIFLFAHLNIQ